MIRSPTLFWRTFLLVAVVLLASLLAWFQSFRVFEREPRAQQIAQQLVSIVSITRSALLYSDPAARRDLLAELADNEGIRIMPREPADRVVDQAHNPLADLVRAKVRERLGTDTRLASEVNGVPGNWISFSIEGDAYWVFVESIFLWRDWRGRRLTSALVVPRQICPTAARPKSAGSTRASTGWSATCRRSIRIARCCWRAFRTICALR